MSLARRKTALAVAGLAEVVVTEMRSTPGDPGFGFPQGTAQRPDGTVWVGDQQAAEVSETAG